MADIFVKCAVIRQRGFGTDPRVHSVDGPVDGEALLARYILYSAAQGGLVNAVVLLKEPIDDRVSVAGQGLQAVAGRGTNAAGLW